MWTLKGAFRAALAVPQPRGVAVADGGARFVVSFGPEGRLLCIDPCSLRMEPWDRIPRGLFGGAHLYAWPFGPSSP